MVLTHIKGEGCCPGLTHVRNRALVELQARGSLASKMVQWQHKDLPFNITIKELELFYPMEEWLPNAVPQSYPDKRPWTGGLVKNYKSAWYC